MNEPMTTFPQGVLDDFITQGNSQIHSLQFEQYVTPSEDGATGFTTGQIPETTVSLSTANDQGQTTGQDTEGLGNIPRSEFPNVSVTRQEVLFLHNFLGRIPQAFITGEETGCGDTMALTLIDDVPQSALLTTSSQEEALVQSTSRTAPTYSEHNLPEVRGKRRRPRYSLTGSMFKRHPVLKFSATGPLDQELSPFKWWCRVCRVELSLMSRGSLELISHYRSESHLVREHRIRMEIPGMPLYDKDEHELLGISLQEAKKKAKDTYPIPPQLDTYRPLVGQDSVPDFSASTTPTEKIFSQINILEFGLRHGGNVASLTGMYDELVRLTASDRLSFQNWSNERLFVSFFVNFFNTQWFNHILSPSLKVSITLKLHYKLKVSPFSNTLTLSLFAGYHSLHVPRTHGLLCTIYIFFGVLFIGHTTYSGCHIRYSLLLGRECAVSSVHRGRPSGNVNTKEGPFSCGFLSQSVRNIPKLCIPHWIQ